MDIKGVCYDLGRAYSGYFLTRRVFEPAATRRELQIIRDDLHCNADFRAVHIRATFWERRELSSVRPDERGWPYPWDRCRS